MSQEHRQQSPPIIGDGVATVTKNSRRDVIVPIVNDQLEQVSIALAILTRRTSPTSQRIATPTVVRRSDSRPSCGSSKRTQRDNGYTFGISAIEPPADVKDPMKFSEVVRFRDRCIPGREHFRCYGSKRMLAS